MKDIIVALLVTPVVAFLTFKKGKQHDKENWIRRLSQALLDKGLKYKAVVVLFILILGGVPKFYITTPITVNSIDFGQIMTRVDVKKTNRFSSNTHLANYLQHLFDTNISR